MAQNPTATLFIGLAIGGIAGFLVGKEVERFQNPIAQVAREVLDEDRGWEATRRRAYLAAMKYDLKNFITAQGLYLADHHTYAPSADVLRNAGMFAATTGVTIEVITADDQGFAARARHELLRDVCSVFIGAERHRPSPNQQVGEIICNSL